MKTQIRAFDVGLTSQRLLAVAALLMVWQLVIWSGSLPSMTPGVPAIVTAIGNAFTSALFWTSLAQTMTAAVSGWLIAPQPAAQPQQTMAPSELHAPFGMILVRPECVRDV